MYSNHPTVLQYASRIVLNNKFTYYNVASLQFSVIFLNISGKSTGFVVTSKVTHASPAPLYAVSPDRSWENDALLPRHARQHGCKDIGAQLADPVGSKIDVSEFLETTGCSADKQWRIQGGPSYLSVQIVLLSCIFQQNFCKIIGWCTPFESWRRFLGNPGSATDKFSRDEKDNS